jgi:membrane protease YdiL (CAAX protease family)
MVVHMAVSAIPPDNSVPIAAASQDHLSDRSEAQSERYRLPRSASVILLAYLALIFAAELLTVWRPMPGMIMHVVLLLMLLQHAGLREESPFQGFLLALSLAPLTRILSLAMPLGAFPQAWWYVIISLPLFAASAVIARQLGLRSPNLGLRVRMVPAQLLIALLGIPLGIMEYMILRPAPLLSSLDWRTIWLPALILLIGTGFLEELIFRGLLQHVAWRVMGQSGLIYVSGIFAALHIGHRSLIDIVFVFLVALLFALLVHRTRTILGVTLAHGLTNSMLFLICPFLFAR